MFFHSVMVVPGGPSNPMTCLDGREFDIGLLGSGRLLACLPVSLTFASLSFFFSSQKLLKGFQGLKVSLTSEGCTEERSRELLGGRQFLLRLHVPSPFLVPHCRGPQAEKFC